VRNRHCAARLQPPPDRAAAPTKPKRRDPARAARASASRGVTRRRRQLDDAGQGFRGDALFRAEQITPANVGKLSVTSTFSTASTHGCEAPPLVAMADLNVGAADARDINAFLYTRAK